MQYLKNNAIKDFYLNNLFSNDFKYDILNLFRKIPKYRSIIIDNLNHIPTPILSIINNENIILNIKRTDNYINNYINNRIIQFNENHYYEMSFKDILYCIIIDNSLIKKILININRENIIFLLNIDIIFKEVIEDHTFMISLILILNNNRKILF
jgi:hypothetical protein